MDHPGKTNQSIDRALQILCLFSLEKPQWTLTEISEQLNFYKSTVHNSLAALAHRGFIQKDAATEKYSLTIKLFELGSVVLQNLDIRKLSHPVMEALEAEFGETVHLGILSGFEVLSIEQMETARSLRPTMFVGKRAPLHCTAVGKALLAHMPADAVAQLARDGLLRSYTAQTITDRQQLLAALDAIRSQGFAIDDREHEDDVRCAAAPIWDHNNQVAASLSISGPAVRMDETRTAAMAQRLKTECGKLSKKMGCFIHP